jgi:hypothetical protein
MSMWICILGTENPPKCLRINRSLEHEESVSAVVVLELFTICTKVSGAECTVVPLSNDRPQVPVAAHRDTCEVSMKTRCFDVGEQLPRARTSIK